MDLSKDIMMDLGITVIGDIIAILKHAKQVYRQVRSGFGLWSWKCKMFYNLYFSLLAFNRCKNHKSMYYNIVILENIIKSHKTKRQFSKLS